MPTTTFQTIKLSKGKHAGPGEGVCVMELASMLADEPFSDHPASVCPVIGSFLRAYNDSVGKYQRQDLYAYAAKVVGSRASAQVELARSERLMSWMLKNLRRRWTRFVVPPGLRTIGQGRNPSMELIGAHAVRSISKHNHETHADVLALVDELLAIAAPEKTLQPAAEPDRCGQPLAAV